MLCNYWGEKNKIKKKREEKEKKRHLKEHDNAKLIHQAGKILQPPPNHRRHYRDSGFVMNHKEGQTPRVGLSA